jgi:hypothetical protein
MFGQRVIPLAVLGVISVNIQVQPAIVDAALPIPRALDIERLRELAIKLNDGLGLIEHVAATRKQANHEVILDHVELLADMFADVAFEVLEMLLQAEREDEDADE